MLYTACSLNPNSAKCCMRPRKKIPPPPRKRFLGMALCTRRACRFSAIRLLPIPYKKMRTPIRAQIQRVSSRKVPSTVSPSTGSARRASFLCFLEFSETCSTIQFFLNCARKKSGIPAPLPPISILKIAPKKAAIYKNRKCGRRHNPAARAKFPKKSAGAASS